MVCHAICRPPCPRSIPKPSGCTTHSPRLSHPFGSVGGAEFQILRCSLRRDIQWKQITVLVHLALFLRRLSAATCSGFTAKLAGTERGITEPTPTFSACFGQAFLELHPTKYAEELVKKMEKSGAKAYLVNTGWNGTGKRISIRDTRGIIDAILGGDILTAPTKKIPYFNFEVPTALPGVDPAILDPRDTYKDAAFVEYTGARGCAV